MMPTQCHLLVIRASRKGAVLLNPFVEVIVFDVESEVSE